MATGKANKRTVDALKPSAGVAFLWDDDLKRFGAKITPAGAVADIYQYRMGGREAKTRRYTIGAHGSPWTRPLPELKPSALQFWLRKGATRRRPTEASAGCRKPRL